MTNLARGWIVGLLLAVIALCVALAVALANSGDDGSRASNRSGDRDAYVGMMGAMGAMDSDAMLGHMRAVLGDDAYARMLDHLDAHKQGATMVPDSDVDQMMHAMMDGMMEHLQSNGGGMMGSGGNRHHVTPSPAASPSR